MDKRISASYFRTLWDSVIWDFRQLSRHFRQFLVQPALALDGAPLRPAKAMVFALLAQVTLAMLVVVPLLYLLDWYIIPLRQTTNYWINHWGTIVFGLVIVAPLIEEFLFRYPLVFARNISLPLMRNREANFKAMIYVSSIAFGLVHLSNYSNTEVLFYLLAPIITSSQLFCGFVLAYFRVQYGIWWSVLTHASFNGMMWLTALWIGHDVITLDTERDGLELVITEYMYIDKARQTFRIYRSDLGIDSMVVRQIGLQELLDSIQPGWYVEDVVVDLEFHSRQPIGEDSVLSLLREEYRILETK